MGKKSKRRGGKRNPPNQLQRSGVEEGNLNEKFQRIRRDIDALWKKGDDRWSFGSEARNIFSEVIALLMSETDMLMENHCQYYVDTWLCVCTVILQLEYRERNFDNMILVYGKTVEMFGIVDVPIPTTTLYYNLALVVTGKLDASKVAPILLKYTHTKDEILEIGAPWIKYIFEFCRMKEWKEALDLDKRVGPTLDRGTDWYNSHLIRATIYIEQYRVEACNRPKSERNRMSLSLHKYISIEICKAWKRKNHIANGYHTQNIYLIHAQWLYLNQYGTFIFEKVVNNVVKPKKKISPNARLNSCSKCGQEAQTLEATQLCSRCQSYSFSSALATLVQKRLDAILRYMERNSCLCCAIIVPESSALVCSGCRVACFCSLEHQRSSWKKDERGLGIGHKMLCPLLKTYRKYKYAKKTQKGNEKEYLLRFERECEIFFSESLSLKDLCFPREFVDQNYEECKGLFDISTM